MAAPTLIPKSTYYDGPVTESDRAQGRAGAPDFTVYGTGDLKLSAHPTIPFALVVAKGKASAYGVTAFVEAEDGSDLVLQCDANTTGTRWDIITLRYDWRPELGGPTDIRAINAGGKQIPTTLENTPGSLVDQPAWLVRWEGNASAPAEYIDLRCWAGNGGMMANDRLALQYLKKPGASVRIGSVTWEYQEIGNQQWDWVGGYLEYSPLSTEAWSTEGSVGVEPISNGRKRVTVDMLVRRAAGQFTVGTAFVPVATLIPSQARGASVGKYLPVAVSGASQNILAMGFVNTTSGIVSIRGIESFLLLKDSVFSINCFYYI